MKTKMRIMKKTWRDLSLGGFVSHIGREKAKAILREYNGDVEFVTNLLLENPHRISSIEEHQATPEIKPNENAKFDIQKGQYTMMMIFQRAIFPKPLLF